MQFKLNKITKRAVVVIHKKDLQRFQGMGNKMQKSLFIIASEKTVMKMRVIAGI